MINRAGGRGRTGGPARRPLKGTRSIPEDGGAAERKDGGMAVFSDFVPGGEKGGSVWAGPWVL
jgi:hypothetical protein